MSRIFRIFFTLLLLFIFQASVLAETEIKFSTASDSELYTNALNNALNLKRNILSRFKIDFQNTKAKKGRFDELIAKKTFLYIPSEEVENIIIQAPTGFGGSFAKIHLFSGIGLTKLGYQNYRNNFTDIEVTYKKPKGDYIVIQPEILSFDYYYLTVGAIKGKTFIIPSFIVQITVTDNSKEILQKTYKSNYSDVSPQKQEENECSSNPFNQVASMALNSIFQKNIADLLEKF